MKKITSIILTLTLILGSNALAFTFPEPDWGALLADKKRMVTDNTLELYTEGSIENAPYYGAKFEPRAGAYLGMVAETSQNFKPIGSYLTYIEDMWQDDLYYPANEMIRSDNVITMIGWTIGDINSVNYDKVRQVLNTLNSYNKPMLIRFANEMNVSSLGDNPDKYIEVFRTVANMIHEYENFAVVWSPNDLGALDRPFEYFYPGDEYVDWIGVSCYMIKYFMGNQNTSYNDSVYFMTGDYAWASNRIKPIVEFMEKNNIKKPLMLSECGVPTNNNFGENLESWSAPRIRDLLYSLVMKYPQIKMINYFNIHRANEAERYDISDYSYAADIFNEARKSGAYITEYGKNPRFAFASADKKENLEANSNGVVKLYTNAYFGGQSDVTINYSVDGKWYHSSNKIPYTCNLNISSLADGKHTISVWAFDETRSYTFYKYGKFIRFGAEVDKSLANVSSDISVTLNGNKIAFDQPPVIKDDRTLVPLRAIFEALGATVDWNGESKTITATRNGLTVKLAVGDNKMYVGEEVKNLDVPAQIINDRTLVPVRAISEAYECSVNWNGETKTVIITH